MARARLTIPDLMFLLFSLAVFGALWPVFDKSLNQSTAVPIEAEYLLILVLPLSLLVVFSVIFVKAREGI